MIEIIQGDCLEVLKGMDTESVDTIITDPPYGLSFMGKKWDYDVPKIEVWQECLRVLRCGGTALIFAGSRTQHRMACNVEDAGFLLFDTIMWLYGSGFPKSTNISKQIQKMSGKKAKVVGVSNRGACNKPNGSTFSDDNYEWKRNFDITEPTDEQAKLWDGWGTHLKPAFEPIICARKPNDGTYANNALVHRVSGLNIDGARIGDGSDKIKGGCNNSSGKRESQVSYAIPSKASVDDCYSKGRFPANIILDESVAEDAGDWSRYFYCAKASNSERNAGCEGLEKKQKVFNGQSQGSSTEMKDVEERFTAKPSHNHHPTVKPLALMEYLCTLTKTPTGGTVLDPFMGSGTTGVACVNANRDFIGIERDTEYVKIAESRIRFAKKDKIDKMGLFNA